jgi:hypothetical protein
VVGPGVQQPGFAGVVGHAGVRRFGLFAQDLEGGPVQLAAFVSG